MCFFQPNAGPPRTRLRAMSHEPICGCFIIPSGTTQLMQSFQDSYAFRRAGLCTTPISYPSNKESIIVLENYCLLNDLPSSSII